MTEILIEDALLLEFGKVKEHMKHIKPNILDEYPNATWDDIAFAGMLAAYNAIHELTGE